MVIYPEIFLDGLVTNMIYKKIAKFRGSYPLLRVESPFFAAWLTLF